MSEAPASGRESGYLIGIAQPIGELHIRLITHASRPLFMKRNMGQPEPVRLSRR
ncbi:MULTISPECIES: hypothetical protein [Asaia]|uniref:Uncharacterized protein n=1 Tax=Asaia bogorensis TaxID=91915 RepID=A0A060QHZ7_9PROT|nr:MULTISPECIES: hypothetical protein [Asaia]MDL2170978.1 hypothetical protein [Asaia sp. HumB]CDG40764.1 hypothetical protein ASAP_2719 [Asaia bogorensis]